MSFSDQKEFLKDICPFCELDDSELDEAVKDIEIGFYPHGTVLIEADSAPEHLYMIIKGEIKAFDTNRDIVRVYHAKETFDGDALLSSSSNITYEVTEDLITYELTKKGFMKLFDNNKLFRQFYLMDTVEKINYLKKRESSSDLSSFMVVRVNEIYLHKPCIVDKETPLSDALGQSVEMKSSSIIVKNGDEYGIVTDRDIKNALVSGDIELDAPVMKLAKFPLVSAQKDDFLFNVYLQLIQKNIKRIGIMDGDKLSGMLEQVDVLSYFANHSHLVTVKIEKAEDIDSLRQASLDYLKIIRKLYAQGVKSRYIAKLVSEINRKIFLRLFEMVLPPDLQKDCTLIVMGSEGRGEQIIRTDQDNGLIVRDGVDVEQYRPFMEEFSDTLTQFGYPPCPGDIMVSNRYWTRNESSYRSQIEKWINTPNKDSFMEFSIFFDAQCVAGECGLLDGLKDHLFEIFNTNDNIYMGYFAKLTTLFETPVGFFSTFLHRDRRIDIKKAGIFPIVQGVRSLSLQYNIKELSTVNRIKQLVKKGIFDESLSYELIEALEILFYLRLSNQIKALDKGAVPDNTIITDDLSKIQRDLLKDSLLIVERFKKFIIHHFELENIR